MKAGHSARAEVPETHAFWADRHARSAQASAPYLGIFNCDRQVSPLFKVCRPTYPWLIYQSAHRSLVFIHHLVGGKVAGEPSKLLMASLLFGH